MANKEEVLTFIEQQVCAYDTSKILSPKSVTEEMPLRDMGLDSLELECLMIDCEKRFEISLPTGKFELVGDLVSAILEKC